MRKSNIFAITLTISVLFLSCKKEEVVVKAKLLPSEITGITEYSKENITYNEDNMITRYEYTDDSYNEIYIVEYTDKKPNRLTEDMDGEIAVFDVTYSSDGKYVYLTDTRNATRETVPNYKLTLDASGNLTVMYIDNPGLFEDYEITYGYDTHNNMVSYPWGQRTLEYDLTKKSIFTNSATPSWLGTYYNWFVRGIFSSNLLIESKGDTETTVYTWLEYNKDDFPEKMTITYSDYDIPLEYDIKYTEAK